MITHISCKIKAYHVKYLYMFYRVNTFLWPICMIFCVNNLYKKIQIWFMILPTVLSEISEILVEKSMAEKFDIVIKLLDKTRHFYNHRGHSVEIINILQTWQTEQDDIILKSKDKKDIFIVYCQKKLQFQKYNSLLGMIEVTL